MEDIKYYYEFLDLSDKRDVYVVGDIHGCFSRLEDELGRLCFDQDKDFLVSVGDLVDRGPESEAAVEWVKKSWFKHVLGNHEIMAAFEPRLHYQNGGQWFGLLDITEQDYHIAHLLDAPTILEFKAPDGKHYGAVHAEYPENIWSKEVIDGLLQYSSEPLVWGRSMIKNCLRGNLADYCEGIEHIFHGHTPLKKAMTFSNRSWIDTGAVFVEDGGFFTIKKIGFGDDRIR